MPDTQYFTNIDGKYVKDAEARQQLSDLEDYVENLDQPWQPLQDGYSNFWFELTNDTLSPWLNFSAKNADAVIDWGDGSGEVALDTLTPTHTYSKAGRYIVKVKGVTGIARQFTAPYSYNNTLRCIELNNEVTRLEQYCFTMAFSLQYASISTPNIFVGNNAFDSCTALEKIFGTTNFSIVNSGVCQACYSLKSFELPSIQSINNIAFYVCRSLSSITIPATVTLIGTSSFNSCQSLTEIHIKPIVPPVISNVNAFGSLPSDYIMYVPVGYGDTYKAASGWSTYADHILEEGQTPNRMMLAKFNSAKTDEPQDDMR